MKTPACDGIQINLLGRVENESLLYNWFSGGLQKLYEEYYYVVERGPGWEFNTELGFESRSCLFVAVTPWTSHSQRLRVNISKVRKELPVLPHGTLIKILWGRLWEKALEDAKHLRVRAGLTIIKVSLLSHGHMTPRDAGVRFIKKLRDHVINSLISHAKTDVWRNWLIHLVWIKGTHSGSLGPSSLKWDTVFTEQRATVSRKPAKLLPLQKVTKLTSPGRMDN